MKHFTRLTYTNIRTRYPSMHTTMSSFSVNTCQISSRPDSLFYFFIFLKLLLSSTQVLTSLSLFRNVETLSNFPMSAHFGVARMFCCQMLIDRQAFFFHLINREECMAEERRILLPPPIESNEAKSLFNLLLYLLCSHPLFLLCFCSISKHKHTYYPHIHCHLY